MLFPEDTPRWLERAVKTVESEVEDLITKSSTSDAAMKAAGAYLFLNKLKAEIELEYSRQKSEQAKRLEELHARNRADA